MLDNTVSTYKYRRVQKKNNFKKTHLEGQYNIYETVLIIYKLRRKKTSKHLMRSKII